jgi:2-dehydro-3-deoxygluconokinase
MALLDPPGHGPLELGTTLTLRIGGAESNFSIALARLGVGVRWISRLGADPLGDVVLRTIAAEGVDVGLVRRDAAPTGVFFKWRSDGKTSVLYYRGGSAASRLEPGDVPDEALDGIELVHLTGITMALGPGPRALVVDLARRACERRATVVFDPNWRPALWPSPREATEAHAEVLPYVDWYLCGEEEGALLAGGDSPEATVESIRALGARDAVVRLGARGAFVHGAVVAPERREEVVDEVGAGDAFAAGFAYGLLHGEQPARCAALGNIVAATCLRGTGDWETLPHLEELRELTSSLPNASARNTSH